MKPSDVKTFLSTEGTRRGKSSYNQHVFTIRAMFQLAVDDRIIADSPAADIKQIKWDKPICTTPTFEQFEAMVADIRAQAFNADASDSGDFVEFIGLAGLGQAETASLTWGDIDLEHGAITTFKHKTSQGFQIPIYPQLRPFVERLHGGNNHAPDHMVFKIKDAKKALAGACKRLGFPNHSRNWVEYYYDGTNWRDTVTNTVSDSLVIPAGTAYIIGKTGTSSSYTTLSQTVPCTLP